MSEQAVPLIGAAQVASEDDARSVEQAVGAARATSATSAASAASAEHPIPAIAFVGKQNSGKTTLLEQVIAELTARGVRVATLKHHSHVGFDFDVPGKDSWRHRQAGSAYTVVAAPDQIASVQTLSEELAADTIVSMMCSNAQRSGTKLDIILVEGYRHGEIATIELFRAGNPKDEERELGGEGNEIVAVVTNIERIHASAKAQKLPSFDFADINGIADFLHKNYL